MFFLEFRTVEKLIWWPGSHVDGFIFGVTHRAKPELSHTRCKKIIFDRLQSRESSLRVTTHDRPKDHKYIHGDEVSRPSLSPLRFQLNLPVLTCSSCSIFTPYATSMSRHNRRRTRDKASHPNLQIDGFGLPSLSADTPNPKLSIQRHLRRNDPFARHWHNRFLAWQARERKQKEEWARFEEAQKRIFGGDSQDGDDDDGLCTQMMNYFVGLDYLEW